MTAVLGGGLGGLSAAYYLMKSSSQKVTIIESSNVLGGWIRSIKNPKEGFIFEKGPRTVRPVGALGLNTLSLIEELNLADKVVPIMKTHPSAKYRMIYSNKMLHTLPSDFKSLFKTCPPFSRPLILSALTDLKAPRVIKDDESIHSFIERRLGKDLAELLISPMICGICAGNAKEISVKFLMKGIFEYEQKHGSIFIGLLKDLMGKKDTKSVDKYLQDVDSSVLGQRSVRENWSVWYLKDGLQVLPDTLGTVLQEKGVKVKFNSLCSKLEFQGKNQVTCVVDEPAVTLNGMFDHVVCSLPATSLAKLVAKQHPTLSKILNQIKSVNVAVVNLAYRGKHLKHNAFGFLVPPKEKVPILGVIFDSCIFEYEDYTVVTVMMGGHWYDEYFGPLATEETMLDTAQKEVAKILEITVKPEKTHASILRNCIPQYTVGHSERVEKVISYIKDQELPLSVVGSSYFGVGINDVIYSAKKGVHDVLSK